ncbi:MAG: arylsulfatase [Phycisphaerae bacterium]|nr:arylsulfatase [Phycisphaerae bacterium]
MNRRKFLKASAFTALAPLVSSCNSPLSKLTKTQKPNIILIMADDMGYSDIGCFGSEINTPNLDNLANNGLRYTNFYNAARCCPTRASLLTGLYPHQTGLGWMTAADGGRPGYRGQINNKCVTIAEALKSYKYNTYMSGKWHVALDKHLDGSNKENWPCQRGFEKFFGTICGGGNYFAPQHLKRNNEPIEEFPDDFYYTDAISDNASQFIKDHNTDNPFFMYVAYTSPHWPLHAKKQDIAKYAGKYVHGWDKLRQSRYEKMIEMGIIDKSWALSDRDKGINEWEKLAPEKQKDMAQRMAIYAAQIDSMDQGIGQIINTLKDKNQLDNTIIFFLADNGGCAEYISWGKTDLDSMGTEESFESYRKPWANASNTPFKLYKHYTHEGGISTPLIVHWPNGIKHKNQLRRQPSHIIDIMATCIDVSGTKYPTRYNGNDIIPFEGKSLKSTFDNTPFPSRPIFWEHESNRAIQLDNYKLVARDKDTPWQLYNLAKDRTETNNLSREMPEKVEQLNKLWQAWAKRCDVLPLSNKGWDARIKESK